MKRKLFKRTLAMLLSVITVLSSFAVGTSTIASATAGNTSTGQWVNVKIESRDFLFAQSVHQLSKVL